MNDDTRTRFLAAIARRIPREHVTELHLFPAIRQGGMESGVAVIAVAHQPVRSLDVDGGFNSPPAMAEAADIETPTVLVVHDELVDESQYVADEMVDDATIPARPSESEQLAARAAVAAAVRYTVFSARYRHTLKGIDRGKWEVSVTEEADAPLLTVDAVVRGVSRRSGDADETVRLSGDEFREAIALVVSVPVASGA